MSHLQYFSYEGFGDRVRKDTHYSQAVRIGDVVKISGQGGWDRITEKIPTDIEKQVAQAFDNVEHTLQKAGSKGWEQVYQVRIYCAPDRSKAMGPIISNLKKYCPNHQPLLTGVEVASLYNGMAIEIEVEAHLG
ncbi:YjgF-like protein [Westerdykella ornata]|uniref:YjgF-like protein n=1 Tax=Westerdykella ornata TaxID=318751 RepID=A0A6A6JJI9_WESOR|nr:YjgF-like protein [Westerdykella ornata]KAF2276810.1 YjgF-like protein [Westerdykella ornata]